MSRGFVGYKSRQPKFTSLRQISPCGRNDKWEALLKFILW